METTGLLQDVGRLEDRALRQRWAAGRALVAAVEGTATIEGRDLRVRVGICGAYPGRLPHIFLADVGALGFLPHVEPDTGWVCYESPEGLSVSLRYPDRVLEHCLSLAIKVVGDGLSGRNRDEFADETEAYWRTFSDDRVPSYVEPDARLRRVAVGYHKRRFAYVADDHDKPLTVDPSARRSPGQRWGLYVPLPATGSLVTLDPRTLTDSAALWDLLDARLDAGERTQLVQLMKTPLFSFVVLGLPRRDGTRSLVGIYFPAGAMAGQKPPRLLRLGPGGPRGRLVHLERRDRSALRERGGARRELASLKIAVIGCGSVGGHIAASLARSGVGHLVLIDPDVLKYENVFRHVLGATHVGQQKVAALKRELERNVPYLTVRAIPKRVLDAIEDNDIDISKIHLAIVAIGNPTETRLVNQPLLKADVPAIYTWLEPQGLGGHALLAWSTASVGCYECLFTDDSGGELLAARSDFAAPGQKYARDVTGCASAFTPYGDVDARSTAILAVRLAMDALLDRSTSSVLRSWKGDSAAFVAAGYRLSSRFDLTEAELAVPAARFAQPLCPMCGNCG